MKPLYTKLNLLQYKTIESFTSHLKQILGIYTSMYDNQDDRKILQLVFQTHFYTESINISYPYDPEFSFSKELCINLVSQEEKHIDFYIHDITKCIEYKQEF
jgi:hypothetical protein